LLEPGARRSQGHTWCREDQRVALSKLVISICTPLNTASQKVGSEVHSVNG
jgi:hypothetical protein